MCTCTCICCYSLVLDNTVDKYNVDSLLLLYIFASYTDRYRYICACLTSNCSPNPLYELHNINFCWELLYVLDPLITRHRTLYLNLYDTQCIIYYTCMYTCAHSSGVSCIRHGPRWCFFSGLVVSGSSLSLTLETLSSIPLLCWWPTLSSYCSSSMSTALTSPWRSLGRAMI